MNGFIAKDGVFHDIGKTGMTHERYAFIKLSTTLEDMLKHGYVRLADFGDLLGIEADVQLTDEQLSVLDAALNERDRFIISYRIGQNEHQVQEFRPIRSAKLRTILGAV